MISLGSLPTSGEARGVAGRRGGRGSAAGGWVCAPASDEGGDQRRDEAKAGLLRGGTPLSGLLRSSPTPGARGGFREARRGPRPSSF